MARVNALGIDELAKTIREFGTISSETSKAMLEAGGKVLVEETKQQMRMYGVLGRGTTHASIKHGEVKYAAGGSYIEIWPAGIRKKDYDHPKNTRNAMIAFLAEYGTSKTPARPFMATAIREAADNVAEAMMKVWEERGKK